MKKNDLAIFEDHKIRRIYDEETDTWFFSVIDVVGALTDSVDAGAYWRKLKQRLTQEGSEVVTFCHGLKLKASDGKKYLTDCANTESLFRIIQSIPSPEAEPFKSWLTKVGYERIQKIADPERLLNRTRDNWSNQGCTYDDVPDFYKVYCERELVSLYTAHMLWLDINPDGFDDQEEYHRYLRERGLYQEAIEITIKIQHTTKDSKELEIISTTLAFSPKMQHTIENNILYDANGVPIVHSVNLLKFVLWTEKKNYRRPFPKKLASMIKEFHNVADFRLENERLKKEIEELKKQESKIDSRTEKGFIQILAIMSKINKELTGDNFNANYISNEAAKFEFNFRIMNDETMRKYIAPARELLGLPRVYKNNNKTIPKN